MNYKGKLTIKHLSDLYPLHKNMKKRINTKLKIPARTSPNPRGPTIVCFFILFLPDPTICNEGPTYFNCGNGTCYPNNHVCDGEPDCYNEADESTELCGGK